MGNLLDYGFKLVAIDERNSYSMLEEINSESIDEIHEIMQHQIKKYDVANTGWILLPICKNK